MPKSLEMTIDVCPHRRRLASRVPVLGFLASVGRSLALGLWFPALGAAQIEVTEASITDLQSWMDSGRATSVEITEAYLARIRAYDDGGPRLNSMIRLNPNALAEAAAADAERIERGARGPLHGVPVVIKDNYDFAGMPTSGGSLALAGLMPADDAFQVRRLREAGAVILGKTNMHELAGGITTVASLGGQTLNPYDLSRNPGGSSGGTAVAVTASFAAVGWGTDGCGSIRVPASQSNLVGLRPTKGLSSVDGILPLSRTHDVAAPLARTTRDLAIALDATVGADAADRATRVLLDRALPEFVSALESRTFEGIRIGILESHFDPDPIRGATGGPVRAALEEMRALGAVLIEVGIPGLREMTERAGVMTDEFKWDLEDYLAGVLDPPVRSLEELLELGLVDDDLAPLLRELDRPTERTTVAYLTALAERAALQRAVVDLMEVYGVDVVAYPTLQTVAAHLDDPQVGSNCALSSSSGLPAISFPAGFTAEGLPVGIELLGRPFEDAALLSLAHAFEQATAHRRPPPATPPLSNGAPPPPVTLIVTATGSGRTPPTDSPAEVQIELLFDRVLGRMEYAFEVHGVEASEIYAVVLRAIDAGETWLVLENLSAPEEVSGSGTLHLNAALRSRWERGELYVDLFTKTHPLGAARVRIPPPPRR